MPLVVACMRATCVPWCAGEPAVADTVPPLPKVPAGRPDSNEELRTVLVPAPVPPKSLASTRSGNVPVPRNGWS